MSRFSTGKTSLLKDGSWIKKAEIEDEDIDRDPNFGKSVLSQRSETTVSPDGGRVKTTVTTSKSTSVQALTKKFSGSQDEPRSSSTLPSSPTTPSYTKSDPALKSPSTTFSDRVNASSKGSLYTNFSPTQTVKEPETSVSSSKDAEDKLYDALIPSAIKNNSSPTDSKTSIFSSESVTVKSSPLPQDKPLAPSSGKEVYSSTDRNGIKTTTTTKISSNPEDDLYGTLLPQSITNVSDRPSSLSSSISSSSSSISSSSITTKREIITVESSRGVQSSDLSTPTSTRTTSYSSYAEDLPSTRTSSYTISTTPSDDYSSERSYSYSRPESSYEYSSISSPSTYTSTSYRSSGWSDEPDSIYSSSTKSVYAAPERAVLEKDLCTSCRRPFNGDAKMVLDDMKINCHASCFKCEVCSSSLAHMKAGDSMWIYKRMVHCENCFEIARGQWRR